MYKAQLSKEDLLNDQEDLLVRAFQLAFFIHPNKDIALEITSNAFEMWEVICERQDKRHYYNLRGRFLANQEKKKQRSKVYMHEEQLLQRLIYKLSENYELTATWSKSVDEEGLLVCYLKRLLPMMLKHNSFSAVVGMSRILHKYSNRETVKIYMSLAPNRTTQDIANIERESKRYKSKFFSQLKESFGNFLSISKQENEERFEIVKDPDKFLILLELVEDCLDRFKPWATECISSFNDFIFNDDNPDNEFLVELKRIHSVIHYKCYTQLTTTLNLVYPKDRLEIPLFSLTKNLNDKNSQNRRKPPDATKELSIIPQKLEETAKRRKNTLSGILSIIVDGKEKTVFNLFIEKYKSLQLSEDAELIEIRAKETGLLLTTHLITQEITIKRQKSQNYKIKLEGGQTIDLIIDFLENEQTNQEGKISLHIYYKETYFPRILVFMWRKLIYRINISFQPYAVRPQIAIVLACFIVLTVLSYFYFGYILSSQKPLTSKEEIKKTEPILIKEPSFNIPTNTNPSSNPKPDKLVKQKKSLPKVSKRNLKTNLPIIPPDFTERGVRQAKELFAVKKLYIKLQNQENQEIQEDIEDFITQNSTLKVADFVIQADAILQYSEEKKAVFLVNKTGDVLWQRELLKTNFNKDNLINIINELLKEIERLTNQ